MENNNRNSINKNNRIRHWQRVSAYLVLYDILAVTAAYFLALLLRFDFQFSRIPVVYLLPWLYFAPLYAAICVLIFWRLRLYNSIWRFASFTELQRITAATAVTTIIHIIGVTAVLKLLVSNSEYSVGRMPFSYYIIGPILQAILVTAIRFSYRFILLLRAQRAKPASSNIMIIGAGSAGQILQRDIRRTKAMDEHVVCFIDDNNNKWGRDVDGTPVVGANCILGTT